MGIVSEHSPSRLSPPPLPALGKGVVNEKVGGISGLPLRPLIADGPPSLNKEAINILFFGEQTPLLVLHHRWFASLLPEAEPFPHGFVTQLLVLKLTAPGSDGLPFGSILRITKGIERSSSPFSNARMTHTPGEKGWREKLFLT